MPASQSNDVFVSAFHSSVGQLSSWEDDPGIGGAPEGGALVDRPFPVLNVPPLPTKIDVAEPPRDRFPPGTPDFRYWVAADTLRRSSDFWGPLLPPSTAWNPHVGATLAVVLDAGVDLNAFYDRRTLTFFHAPVHGRTVFSGESPDIVCHEFGHAVLDAVRPQLWDAASMEVDAFHESFGDMSAILIALQLPSVRSGVMAETDGRLFRSSRLSRLAEQLGWAIRQLNADAVEPDCLRNAVNSFFYQSPHDLPTTGPASELSSEPHSFSRVFTAAFLEALAGMLASRPTQGEQDLLAVSTDMAKLLVAAVRAAPIVPAYLSQVGAHLFRAARMQDDGYGEAIKNALVRHGLLSIPGVVTVATAAEPHGITAFMGGAPTLRDLDVSGYGLTVSTIRVEAATAPRRFNVSGAAKAVGDITSPSPDDAARAFVEDLFRRGRIDPNGFAALGVSVFDPRSFKTHELIDEGGAPTLRRRRIDCIPRRARRV